MQMVLDKTQTINSLIDEVAPLAFPHDATRYVRVNLSALVHKALEQRRAFFEQAGIHLVAELPPRTDEESITLGDPDMLLQVIDTLLDSTIRLGSDDGTLKVSLHSSPEILYVEFANSSINIPAEELMHIWKRPKRVGPSSIVNLAEVKRIVEGHGGQVWAESPPGEGGTFHIVLRRPDR
jgi:signal transduction histidine kinase